MTRSSSDAPASDELAVVDRAPSSSWRVVHDLVVAAELRVLVLQRVEAVRALRDDLLHAHAVERLDVLHREHLEDVLVARAAGRVAGAHLARAEDREVDAGALQQLGHRAARLLVPVVERCPRSRPSRGTRGRTVAAGSTISTPSSVVGPVAALALVHAVRRCRSSPSSGRRCRARSGSRSPSARGSGACRGSCRGSRC